jgi:hypothetical protein
MDRTGTQARFWLLCLLYVVFILNHLSSDALGGLTPIEIATGQRPDISALLQVRWFEPVLYSIDHSFASNSLENSGCWVGVAETKAMLLPTLSSRTILRRSSLVLPLVLLWTLPIPTCAPDPIPDSARLLQAGLLPVPVQVMGSLHLHPSSSPLRIYPVLILIHLI